MRHQFLLINLYYLFVCIVLFLSYLDLIQIMNTVLELIRSIFLSANSSNWRSSLLVIDDCIMDTKFILLRRLARFVKPSLTHRSSSVLLEPLRLIGFSENKSSYGSLITAPRNFCSSPLNPSSDSQVPTAIDYQYVALFFLLLFYWNLFI